MSVNKFMKYFKYLELDWKPFAEKLGHYITQIRPEMSRVDPYDPVLRIDKEDLLKYASAELDNMTTGLDFQIENLAIFSTCREIGQIHTDENVVPCRINIPLFNCENSETRFYKCSGIPMPGVQPNGMRFEKIDETMCVQVDQFYLTRPVLFRVGVPHNIIRFNNPSTVRISCTMEPNKDLSYLLD
jgi:hypothetical protein